MSEAAKLRWQCRRGMRELDVLLERYLRQGYARASVREKACFQQLLMLADPDLAGYLLHGEPHEDQYVADLISRIISGTDS